MIPNRQPNIIIIDLNRNQNKYTNIWLKKKKWKNHAQMEMAFSQSLDVGD